jgi:hypothetical protein
VQNSVAPEYLSKMDGSHRRRKTIPLNKSKAINDDEMVPWEGKMTYIFDRVRFVKTTHILDQKLLYRTKAYASKYHL